MGGLFDVTKINGMILQNRFVRSATWEGLATVDGYVTERLTDFMVNLAKGGVGLIITGHAYIVPEGIAAPNQLGLYSDRHMMSLKGMIERVHDAGGKIGVQISHGGRYALKSADSVRLGPSTMEGRGEVQCRAMEVAEIVDVVTKFKEAAGRAKAAGADAVQIHAAHGYLLSQFLSPYFNRREDEYGRDVKGRAKILIDVVRAIRKEVGEGFPILVKLNSQDYLEGGYTVEDMLEVASMLEEASTDAIELSGGNHVAGVYGEFFPARKRTKDKSGNTPYYLEEAKRYKSRISVPLMLVGGIRSFDWAERLISEGISDYVSLSRPLIREPGLIKRWASGDREDSGCISDNGCFRPALEGEGVRCVVP
ncbi:MAG: NADH:flavin oxidoreductase [Syntrophorhabdaceae bacterium]|nr:NADH:flavin oxidoreductase [Syntrophorhabdaceae bacterium]